MSREPYVLAVGALIWNERGKVLLLRRTTACEHFPGQWEPPGGKSAEDEKLGETVLREVREETRLEIELDVVAGAVEFELPDLRVAVLYFHGHVIAGQPQLSSEHCELRWVGPTELNSMQLTEPFSRFAATGGLIRPRPPILNQMK